MTTSDTDQPSEPDEAESVQPCEVCGATGNFVRLDDGTLYCPAHKGLTTIAVVADVGTVEPAPPPTHVAGRDYANAIEDEEPDDGEDLLPWPMEPAIRMVAGLAFDAALATFREDGTFTDPPTGWAPPPANESPFMEAGVCLALATLIEATECDRDVIKALADVFCGRTPTTEGNEDE
jgi:hypothetical protein